MRLVRKELLLSSPRRAGVALAVPCRSRKTGDLGAEDSAACWDQLARLGRQDNGDEQLEAIDVVERDGRVWIQRLKDRLRIRGLTQRWFIRRVFVVEVVDELLTMIL